MIRQSRTDPYGFDFETIKCQGTQGTHITRNVRAGLPAEKAGLQVGDYIIELNGLSLIGMDHDVVISMIASNPTQVDLMVTDDILTLQKYSNKPSFARESFQTDLDSQAAAAAAKSKRFSFTKLGS